MYLKNPLNFIKKANRSFNIYLENYKKINDFLDAQMENQTKLDQFIARYEEDREKLDSLLENQEKMTALIPIYDENRKNMDIFIDSYSSIKDDLSKAVVNFNSNYYKFKDYFYNGEEHQFKNMDTNDFFQMCFLNDIKLLSYSPSENRIFLETRDGIKLMTNNRYYTIKEIFGRGGYSTYHLHQFKEFVVFDVGMNRGYASLKFASLDSCKAVYGFEIDNDTYNFALDNFNFNPSLSSKITSFNFGLSNEDADVDIYCLPGSDGITTTELEFTKTQDEWLARAEQMEIKKAQVKEAGPVIADIIEKDNIKSHIVLKIDTEGSEYKIIDSLTSLGVLDKVDLIMGESHLDSENLDEKLFGFTNISKIYYNEVMYGFIYVKDELYKPLTLKS